MRNNTNYAETGVLIFSLQFVSTFPQVILENFYTKSRNALTAGAKEAPYGFILPADQEDPTRVAFVIHILRMQGIEVGRAKAAIKLSDGSYPVGLSPSSKPISLTVRSPRRCSKTNRSRSRTSPPTTTAPGP